MKNSTKNLWATIIAAVFIVVVIAVAIGVFVKIIRIVAGF